MKSPSDLERLQRWFQEKYHLRSNHELFQNATLEELLIEYYEDLFAKNPLEIHRNQDGEIQFSETGDPLIDKWEEKIASGEEVDLWDSFSPEARKNIEERLERARRKKQMGLK